MITQTVYITANKMFLINSRAYSKYILLIDIESNDK